MEEGGGDESEVSVYPPSSVASPLDPNLLTLNRAGQEEEEGDTSPDEPREEGGETRREEEARAGQVEEGDATPAGGGETPTEVSVFF